MLEFQCFWELPQSLIPHNYIPTENSLHSELFSFSKCMTFFSDFINIFRTIVREKERGVAEIKVPLTT